MVPFIQENIVFLLSAILLTGFIVAIPQLQKVPAPTTSPISTGTDTTNTSPGSGSTSPPPQTTPPIIITSTSPPAQANTASTTTPVVPVITKPSIRGTGGNENEGLFDN